MNNLLSKERDDRGGPSIEQTAGGSTGTAMMDHGGNVLEEPLVRTVSEVKNVPLGVRANGIPPQITPALGNNRSHPSMSNGGYYSLSQSFRIVKDDTPEANVNRRRTVFEPGGEVCWRRIIRRLPKEEPTDVCRIVSRQRSYEKGKKWNPAYVGWPVTRFWY